MSALFFKKDYLKQIELLVDAGRFEAALNFAIKTGDFLYDRGELGNASKLYEKLLDLFKSENFSDRKIFEKLYEKLIPLLFEEGKIDKAVRRSLELVDTKIALGKNEEAHEILAALKEEFKNNEEVLLKDVDIDLREGKAEKALDTLRHMIANISPNPRYMELAAEILLKLGKKEEALDYINTLLSLDRGNAFALAKLKEIKESSERPGGYADKKTKTSDVHNGEEGFNISKSTENPNANLEKRYTSFGRKTTSVKKIEPSSSEKQRKSIDNNLTEKISDTGKSVVHNSEPSVNLSEEVKNLFCDEFYKNANIRVLSDLKYSFSNFIELAKEYENNGKFFEEEYLLLKAFLVKPDSEEVVGALTDIYDRMKRKEDKVFILKIAEKYASEKNKIDYLIRISELVPDNNLIKIEIVRNACTAGNKELALKYFGLIKNIDRELLNEALDSLFPLVNKDLDALKNLALKAKRNDLKSKIAFRYYLTTGKLLFNMGDKPEGLKWLMRANEIEKLPLEDYVKIAEYIKDIPLDTEKDIIASALNGYIDVISSEDEKERIFKLILLLKPNNTLYIRKYAEFLGTQRKYKDVANLVVKLLNKSDINSLDFIGRVLSDIAEYLEDEMLLKAADLFIADGNTFKAAEIYGILQSRNPDNKQFAVKRFILQVENEDMENVIKFFEETTPNYKFSEFVESEITKFEKKRTMSPFDYHIHFVLGFLYYLTERYEEAIASFQFVLRSHRFEILMYLFLGMSFEKIGLPDFAIKRYQSALNMNIENKFIRKIIFTKTVSLLIKQGKIKEAREFATKAIDSGIADKGMKNLLDSIPDEDKIINIKEMKND